MKNNKYARFVLLLFLISVIQSGFSQNAPGGNVTNATSFITALGGNAYSTYQAGVHTVYVTNDVHLSAPIHIINGFYKLIPADSTCTIRPASVMNRLFTVQTGANLTIQGKEGNTEPAFLIFEGTVSEDAKCLNHVFYNSGTLIMTSYVIIENHQGSQATIHNEGTIGLYGGIIQNNSSSGNGGAIYLHSGYATIDSVLFINNSATLGSTIYQNTNSFLLLHQSNLFNGAIYLAENATISVGEQFNTTQPITIQKGNYTPCMPIITFLNIPSATFIQSVLSSFLIPELPADYLFECSNDSLNLIINGINANIYHRTCQQYYLPYTDSTYTSSTTFIHRIETSTSCDSLVQIEIDIRPFHDTISLVLCSYEFPYYIENDTIDSAGTFVYQYQALDGCDSVITYQIAMLPTVIDSQYVSVCDLELPYFFRDSVLTQSGEFVFASACNSFTHLFLQVNSSYDDTIHVSICESNLPYIFSNGESYNATGKYTNSYLTQFGCDSIMTLDLTVFPFFQTDIIGDSVICSNESASFTATGGTQFLWSTGETGPTIAPLTAGHYTVTVSDELNCYTSVDSILLIINQIPELEITGNLPFCELDSITIIPLNGDLYVWNMSDTAQQFINKSNQPIFIQAINNSGCFVTDTIYPTMYPAPIVSFTGTFEICEGDTTFIEATPGFAYLWSNDSISNGITVSPHETTTYYVTVTSEQNCSYTDSVTILVHPKPQIEILGDTVLCFGTPMFLTATGGDTYLWSDGSTNNSIEIVETSSVSVTATTNMGCVATYHFTTRIDTLPAISIIGDFEICSGEMAQIGVISEAPVLWSTNEITNNIAVTPNISTVYSVTATNSFGCQTTDSVEVIVHENPTAQILGNDQFCSNTFVNLTAEGGVSYLWNTGLTDPLLTTNIAGTYSVTVTNEFGCSTVISKTVGSLTAPVVTIAGDSLKCTGQSTIFTAGGGDTYLWSTGSTENQITVQNADIYTVTATSSNGCSAIKSIHFVLSEPQIVISGDTSICVGETTILTASGGSAYLWSINNQTSSSVFLSPVQTSFYYVTVTNTLGCSAVKLVTLIVNPLPNVSIMGENSICQGDITTLTANGGNTFLWSNGSTTASIYVSNAGYYTVTATSTQGCSSTATTSVTVKTKPNVSILGVPSFCQGGSTTLTATGGMNYVWSNGSNAQVNTISIPGTYSVTVTNSNNCTAVASIVVVMNEKPSASILGNRTFCANSQTVLTAMGGANYLWNDGSSDQSLTVTSAGTYTVTVSNQNGCTSSVSATTTAYAVPTPSISGNSEFCQGLSVNLIASGGVTYQWSTGATSTYINVNQTGTYIVTATDSRGCTAEATKTVIAHPLPQITISGDTNICTGGSSFLVANVNGGTSYVWSNSQTTPFINVSPATTTNYTVIVTNTNGCSNSANIKVNVRPYPTPIIVGNSSFCSGDTLQLTAQGGATFLWNNNATTESIQITEGGTYSVTVTSQYGCSTTISKTITKNNLPIPVITGNGTICEGQNGTLTASGGVTYAWSNNVSTAVIHPSSAGTYTVTVTDANGCSSTISTDITVNVPPTVSIVGDTAFCQGTTIILNATGTSGVSYQWSNSSSGNSISVNTPGIYSVTATHLNGCTASTSQTISTLPLPNVNISGTLNPCLGKGTTLTATGGVSYLWSNGNNNDVITVNPSVATTYSVTVNGNNGCIGQNSVMVSPLPIPSVNITGGAPICQGETAIISASGGNIYQWSTGVNGTTISATVSGTYTVTATNSMGCTATSSVPLLVNPIPTAEITGNGSLCEGNSTQLEASGGISYLWSNSATTPTITINPSQSGSYSCTVTNNFGCQTVVSKPITIIPLPVPQLYGGTQLCSGSSLTLTAAGGESYMWNDESTGSQYVVNQSGLYSVTVTSNGCSASTHTYIDVIPNPIPTISDPISICNGTTTTLTAGGGVEFHWSNDSNNPSINVGTEGVYTVTVTNTLGCTATTSTSVTILSSPTIIINGDLEICNGENTFLTASGGNTYLWSTTETTPQISVSPINNTIYYVTVTNSIGCTSTTSAEVVVRPTYLTQKVAQICQGQSYNGQGFVVPVQNVPGEFTFYNNYQSQFGCDSIIKLTLTVKPKPVITQQISGPAVINVSGNYTYMITNTQYATSYEWLINNPTWSLSGSSTNSTNLTVNNPGTGTISVYGLNECGASSPATLMIQSTVNIDEVSEKEDFQWYPNPTKDKVYLKMRDYQEVTHIQLFEMNGKLILTQKVNDPNIQFDLSDYSNGIYLVKLFNQKTILYTSKIIKQQ